MDAERIGVVVIGRNEGPRLGRALASVARFRDKAVYVDAGSSDGSAVLARNAGFEVLELRGGALSTAGAARNAGIEFLRRERPALECVQLLDGDCILEPGWIDAAASRLAARSETAAVFGAVRESSAGFFSWLFALERRLAPGEERSSGGNAFVRLTAYDAAGGFDPYLLAAEDADLWRKISSAGRALERLDRPMLTHESGVSRIIPWLRRLARQGYGVGQIMRRNKFSLHDELVRRGASLIVFGFLLPLLLVAGSATFGMRALILAVLFLFPYMNLYRTVRRRGCAPLGAAVYAATEVVAKLPQAAGVLLSLARNGARCAGSS